MNLLEELCLSAGLLDIRFHEFFHELDVFELLVMGLVNVLIEDGNEIG